MFQKSEFILLEDTALTENTYIVSMVKTLLDSTFELDYPLFFLLKTKWLNILAPNFVNKVIPEDELDIPYMFRVLTAYLVVRDFLLKIAQDFLNGMGVSYTNTTTGSNTTGAAGAIKKIVSGPLETEYFGESDKESTVTSYQKAFLTDGMFDNISTAGCTLASSLGIYLSFCGHPPNTTITPRVVKL